MTTPCPGCQEAARLNNGKSFPLNPNLDAAEIALIQAYVFEVKPEHRDYVPQIIEALDKMKTTQPIPTLVRLASLYNVSKQVLSGIGCPYCRNHSYYRVCGGIETMILFEQGKRWEATKLGFWYLLKGTYWMLRAGYVKLIKPKIWKLKKW